ncbi:ABC transporter permease [Mycolicibacterium nivoides]|uniref:ABC transporter permease n=1 Tax=Mycolicibacterium nivoides TaxID=2487344 RepID=UPI003C2C8812
MGLLFSVPILSMVEFTFRDQETGGHGLGHWLRLLSGQNSTLFATVSVGLQNSAVLVVVTVAIIVVIVAPTTIFVEVAAPRLSRALEIVCLLPMALPAVVLVVGYAPVYRIIGRTFGTGVWSLGLAYGITVLPYAHRALSSGLAAADLQVLSEASRTLGAGWLMFLWRVAVPGLRAGLSAAILMSIAVVLGEFTIASLLNRTNLQTALAAVNFQSPYVSVGVSLLALAFVFVLLVIADRLGNRPGAPIGVGGRKRR